MPTKRWAFLMAVVVASMLLLSAIASGGSLSDERKEEFLRQGQILSMRRIKTGITGSQRATLQFGDFSHDAHIQTIDVFKPEYKTAFGTELNFRDTYKFNIAAYRLDRLINLKMVPVSVERKVKGSTASVTWWVDDVQMMERERYQKKIQAPSPADWMDQMHNVRVFYELVYNADINLGNQLITDDWRLWMVDFTRAFRMSPKLRSPDNLGRIDQRVYNGLRSLTREKVERELGSFLRRLEIDGLLARKDRILEFFDAAIAEKGEARVICKREGH
jgi:hypothetical protein